MSTMTDEQYCELYEKYRERKKSCEINYHPRAKILSIEFSSYISPDQNVRMYCPDCNLLYRRPLTSKEMRETIKKFNEPITI